MNPAPIVLFVFNRLWHTQQTIEALRRNELALASELIIFSDGPRSDADMEHVRNVRDYVASVTGFRSVTIIERQQNMGLASSIIAGVTDIVGKQGRIIVLEDDMVTSPHFLRYMNDALDHYREEDRVISVHGYVYPVVTSLPETFFLKGADCWGWGTWQRGWELFEQDGSKLLAELRAKNMTWRFDYNGTHPYTRMLEAQIAGDNDSWAVRWYASALLKDRLTLYPGTSLVNNIGTDRSGTHCDEIRVYDTGVAVEAVKVGTIPIEESSAAFIAFADYFTSIRTPFVKRFFSRCKKLLRRVQ